MAGLDTKIRADGFEAIEAADGRSFFAPTPETLVELDLAGILPLRQEVLILARRLAREKYDHSVLKSCVETGFHEALDALKAAMDVDRGALRLKIGRKPIATAESISALVGDYSSGIPDAVDIPAGKITALNVLPFPSTPDDYRPVVDMRVRTSFDPQPEELPRFTTVEPNGSWFRFDLSQTVIVQLVPFGA